MESSGSQGFKKFQAKDSHSTKHIFLSRTSYRPQDPKIQIMTNELHAAVTSTTNESYSNFSKSSWPASGPRKNEKQVFSISIGNSTIQWALHGERHNDLNPTTFWRTPHLTMEETMGSKQEMLNCFTQCLCQSLSHWFFGLETESPSIEAMKKQNEKRGFIPTFYIISSNSEQTALVQRLMRDLPCRLIELQKSDFFTQEQGAYPNMGIDRLATLYAALKTCGAPALVFDGGTALTYAATDDNGNVLGGGITAGLQMRFDAMHTGTDALPPISVPEFVEPLVERCIRVSKPLDTFASDTKHAMVSSNLMEVASLMRSVHKQWIDVVGGKNKRKKDSDVFVNKSRQVVICGGSTEVSTKIIMMKAFFNFFVGNNLESIVRGSAIYIPFIQLHALTCLIFLPF